MSGLIIPLLQGAYPHLRLVTHEQVVEQKLSDAAYATYCLGLFFDDTAFEWQPTDFRHVGLHRTAGYILGVDPAEEVPRIALPDESRPIEEPYVCIAVQASTQCKHWTNPHGWREVIAFLKGRGFRVICIDQKPVNGHGIVWNAIPHGVEDETGDRPLTERARWLRHCSAFVGLSSGLSWLAWAAGCPVVMVSGFTHRDQLAHLQQLLERCQAPLRPQGFSLLPAAQGHRPAVRMHPADHRRAGDQHPQARARHRGGLVRLRRGFRREAGTIYTKKGRSVRRGHGPGAGPCGRLGGAR
jgi:hypothetical protein